MNDAVLLAFNLDAAAMQALRQICEALSIRLRSVPPEAFALPLGAILASEGSDAAAADPAKRFDEAMLVMCGFEEAQFNALLQALRAPSVPRIDLKAVLTPYNVAWSAERLYGELCSERDEVRRRLMKR